MFDLEEYVRQRLGEIEELDERKFAKEVLLNGLIPVLRLTEQRYLDLEERIKREIEISDDRYVVYTTVIRETDYDPTNTTLFPVGADRKRKEEENSPYLVYFTGDEARRQEFENTPEWDACDPEGKRHKVKIRRAESYREELAELYQVFVYNRIRWITVNTGHLDRFYEVYTQEEDADISGWKLNFGEIQEYIQTGMIPLWNIEKFRFQCMKFMIPCIDDKYYEHELDLKNYDPHSGYMLGINEEVLSVRYEKDKIIMTSLEESFRDWTAYRFADRIDTSSYGYEGMLLSNERKKSFSESYVGRQENILFSRTELFREIESFGLGEYMELKECKVKEEIPEGCFHADMNFFIQEEIFPMETRRILELHFQKKTRNSATCEDMIRFAVSQIQLLLNEYKCVGVLV